MLANQHHSIVNKHDPSLPLTSLLSTFWDQHQHPKANKPLRHVHSSLPIAKHIHSKHAHQPQHSTTMKPLQHHFFHLPISKHVHQNSFNNSSTFFTSLLPTASIKLSFLHLFRGPFASTLIPCLGLFIWILTFSQFTTKQQNHVKFNSFQFSFTRMFGLLHILIFSFDKINCLSVIMDNIFRVVTSIKKQRNHLIMPIFACQSQSTIIIGMHISSSI